MLQRRVIKKYANGLAKSDDKSNGSSTSSDHEQKKKKRNANRLLSKESGGRKRSSGSWFQDNIDFVEAMFHRLAQRVGSDRMNIVIWIQTVLICLLTLSCILTWTGHNQIAQQNLRTIFSSSSSMMSSLPFRLRRGSPSHESLSVLPYVPLIDMRDLVETMEVDPVSHGAWTQGWDVQPVPIGPSDPLKVFVVPHSHCDPGWIKTFDEYYIEQTKGILDTAIYSLNEDPRRKFIWAEISFFEWWWKEQSAEIQGITRRLLKNGQLEFVTGGWVMPDEANAELYAMEINFQEGHDWIRSTFGEQYIPKYGWSIDPFGYSPTMAYLSKKHGLKGILIQRVHYAVKKELAQRQHLEFLWRQTWDAKGDYDIFCHVMPFYSYDVPHSCGPDPSVCCQFDFARSPVGDAEFCPWGEETQTIRDDNLEERSMLLLDQFRKKSALYRSNTVLIPLGDDFRYQTKFEAENQFENYQKIMDYLNSNVPGVSVQFGTLGDYFRSAMGSFHPPLLKGSFFTYSDKEEDYWSGYYTTRAFDKALGRQLERVLYAATAMGATKQDLQAPRRSLSLFQHHDSVTGTAKAHVVEDYAKRIYDAINITQQWMVEKIIEDKDSHSDEVARVIAAATVTDDGNTWNKLLPCWRAGIPRSMTYNLCGDFTESGNSILAYNPLETAQKCGDVPIPAHTIASVELPCEVPGPLHKNNDRNSIQFDSETGLMVHPIKEKWMLWKVNGGGAYLFVPYKEKEYKMRNLTITEGGYVVDTGVWKRTVVEREFQLKGSSSSRNSQQKAATIIDFIYEINLQKNDVEWFVRFQANYNDNVIQNDDIFYTDLNGFNFDRHKFRADMPLQSQVYPMPALAAIQDDHARMTILSEHAQGTASLQNGTIDVWLDRRLAADDGRGLGEGVMDNVPTRTRLRVVLETDGYKNTNHHNKYPKTNYFSKTPSHEGGEEFQITPLCKQAWEELNHPLELFGINTIEPPTPSPTKEPNYSDYGGYNEEFRVGDDFYQQIYGEEQQNQEGNTAEQEPESFVKRAWNGIKTTEKKVVSVFHDFVTGQEVVPIVYMVYNRTKQLKHSIETLLDSDFPRKKVPIIISHDGHIPEMDSYIQSIRKDFPHLIEIYHPHACADHPNTFPGNDPSLNENYAGDSYGHKRSPWATCCKHHFTWMLNTVFEMADNVFDSSLFHMSLKKRDRRPNHFLFMEEDYIVAPTIYSTILNGIKLMKSVENITTGTSNEIFAITLDPSEGYNEYVDPNNKDKWLRKTFQTGPMVLSRDIFNKFQQNKDAVKEYCTFDEYNWDWTLIHLQGLYFLPYQVLVPSEPQVLHMDTEGGMHGGKMDESRMYLPDDMEKVSLSTFSGTKLDFSSNYESEYNDPIQKFHGEGFGGWGHPADHNHCLKLFNVTQTSR